MFFKQNYKISLKCNLERKKYKTKKKKMDDGRIIILWLKYRNHPPPKLFSNMTTVYNPYTYILLTKENTYCYMHAKRNKYKEKLWQCTRVSFFMTSHTVLESCISIPQYQCFISLLVGTHFNSLSQVSKCFPKYQLLFLQDALEP